MTPEQKIKHLVLNKIAQWAKLPLPAVTDENIDAMFDEQDDTQDAINEIREGQVETGIDAQWSRHYESKAVAAKMADGSWVGWTYWYGGGKYGEPEAIDWMDEAYDLECVEEEKVVIVRTFTIKSDEASKA